MVRGGFEPSDANSNKHIGNYFSSLNLKSWEHAFGTISFLLIYQTFASIYVNTSKDLKEARIHILSKVDNIIFFPQAFAIFLRRKIRNLLKTYSTIDIWDFWEAQGTIYLSWKKKTVYRDREIKNTTLLMHQDDDHKYCSCILALFSSHHSLACISPNLSRLQCDIKHSLRNNQ